MKRSLKSAHVAIRNFMSEHEKDSGLRILFIMSRHDLTSCHKIKFLKNNPRAHSLSCLDMVDLHVAT